MTDREDVLEEWETVAAHWRVVVEKLKVRAASVQASITARDRTGTLEEVRYLQGQLEELRALTNMPESEITTLKKEVAKHGGR